MVVTMILGVMNRPQIVTFQKIGISIVPFAILLIYDFIIGGQFRSANFLILLLFATLYYDQAIPAKYLRKIWETLGFVCLALTMIGAYRFLFGFQADKSQNVAGFYDIVNKYVYFGISYLPSTRNSDALYFACGALVFLWRFNKSPRFASWNLLGLLATAGGVALSLSRGIWVSLFLAIALSYDLKRFGRLIPAVAVLCISAFMLESEFLLSLMKNAVISIFDEKSANISVNGYYTYSNQLRFAIYEGAIKDFLTFPFGHGVSFRPSYGFFTGAMSVHSENLYLDLLLVFGVFSFPYFWQAGALIRRTRINRGPYTHLVKSIAVMLASFTLFNSGMDFAFLWFLIALVFMTERSTRFQRPAPLRKRPE